MYTHMLMPQRFRREAMAVWHMLWYLNVQFPLARLVHSPETDATSESVWKTFYPDVPYQVISFAGGRFHSGPGVLGVMGFRCLSRKCGSKRRPQTIAMANWSNYRLGWCRLRCPKCKTTYSRADGFSPPIYHAMCQIAFGVEVFE